MLLARSACDAAMAKPGSIGGGALEVSSGLGEATEVGGFQPEPEREERLDIAGTVHAETLAFRRSQRDLQLVVNHECNAFLDIEQLGDCAFRADGPELSEFAGTGVDYSGEQPQSRGIAVDLALHDAAGPEQATAAGRCSGIGVDRLAELLFIQEQLHMSAFEDAEAPGDGEVGDEQFGEGAAERLK
jgi:hypothetical protein